MKIIPVVDACRGIYKFLSCCLVRSNTLYQIQIPTQMEIWNEYAIQDGKPYGNNNGSRQQFEGIQELAGKTNHGAPKRPLHALTKCNGHLAVQNNPSFSHESGS